MRYRNPLRWRRTEKKLIMPRPTLQLFRWMSLSLLTGLRNSIRPRLRLTIKRPRPTLSLWHRTLPPMFLFGLSINRPRPTLGLWHRILLPSFLFGFSKLDAAWLQQWIQILLNEANGNTCPLSPSHSAHPFSPFGGGEPGQSPEEDDEKLAQDILAFLATSASLSRDGLLTALGNGVSWLVSNYPNLIDVLVDFAIASASPKVCFEKAGPKRSTRDVDESEQGDNGTDKTKALCRRLFLGLLGEMWTKPPKKAAAAAAAAADDECRYFDDMIVTLMVGSHWGDGTWSRVSYRFDQGGKYVPAADSLSREGCVETRIPLETVYGSSTVPVESVDYFAIYDIITSDDLSDNWIFAGDAWNLRGYRIAAKCANSSRALVFEKDMEINQKTRHRGSPDLPSKVWRALIKPDDWAKYQQDEVLSLCQKGNKTWPAAAAAAATVQESKPSNCSSFDALKVELRMGTGFINVMDFAGTYDNLVLQMGKDAFIMAEHPDSGEKMTKTIDIKKSFGSESVDIRDVVDFRLFPVTGQRVNADRWKIEGITFEGRCEGSSMKARYEEYGSVNRWFNRFGRFARGREETELKGPIDWTKWKFSGGEGGERTHDGSEF
ncbi:hypothetical protein CP532_0381 [Ophiocordyceps camponoti-leonardi (nom. inval.)]|nr:hypothetical protein CP532_0381 [Ophiocordyceps camponoti-leonardi (nom. inval.)]